MSKIKYIFFDFDDTISTSPSWLHITKALGGDVEEHKRIHGEFINNKLSYQDAVDAISDLFNTNKPVSKQIFKKACNTIPTRPNAEETIKYLNQKYQTGLLSSALDVCLETFADSFGMKHIIVDSLTHWDLVGNFITFSYTKNWQNWKIERLRIFCKDNNLTLDNIAFIGNGDNDVELFKNIKNSFCIITDDNEDIQKIAPNVISDFEELKGYL